MGRPFFDQIDDELRGMLGPALRDYEVAKATRLIKVWFDEPAFHYEAQLVSARWSPLSRPVIEVGLHLESADPKSNQRVLEKISSRPALMKKLSNPVAGKALGPRGSQWRRLSEVLPVDDEEDQELASEVAERLRLYIVTIGRSPAG